MNRMGEFSTRLRDARRRKGVTQEWLANEISVTSQTISAYERNSDGEKGKTPTLDKAILIAQTLGVSLDYLCGLECENHKEDTGCSIESLGDIVECLIKIASFVRCYGGIRTRKLTEEEDEELNAGIPDVYRMESLDMAVFTMDNQELARFFKSKNKVMSLYNDGTIDRELCDSIIDGQIAKLKESKVKKKTPWYPTGIDNDSAIIE